MTEPLHDCVIDAVQALGYELYHYTVTRSSISGTESLVVQIDHPGGVTIQACSLVAKQLKRSLQVISPEKTYSLEVSSPGIERALYTEEHYQRYVGRMVNFRLLPQAGTRTKRRGVVMQQEGEVVISQPNVDTPWKLNEIASATLIDKSLEG